MVIVPEVQKVAECVSRPEGHVVSKIDIASEMDIRTDDRSRWNIEVIQPRESPGFPDFSRKRVSVSERDIVAEMFVTAEGIARADIDVVSQMVV